VDAINISQNGSLAEMPEWRHAAAIDSPRPDVRKRILFVDHTAALGGGEIALLNLVRYLDPSRFRAIVLLFSEGPLAVKLRDAGVETHILSLEESVTSTRKDTIGISTLLRVSVVLPALRQVIRLRRFIRDQQIDVVHANSLKADIIAGLAARWARVPLIWHVRDRITADYLPSPVVWAFRFLARRMPAMVVANSAATLQTLKLSPTRPAAVVYSGIELESETISPLLRDPSHPPLIGLIGRITRWKGQDVFLRAAAEVLRRFPQARFQIIGGALFQEQDFEREITKLTSELGLEAAVEFTGFRSDVPELIKHLDILVHASTTGEPFGQVVVEGMAAGKAVVATDGGGVPEIVVPDETGILVPMGDAEALARGICRLLESPQRALEMGRRGRSRVEALFTIQHTVSKMESLYDSMPAVGSARATAH
jgi:glycosyltransferase involved in cell wall biosynthesis